MSRESLNSPKNGTRLTMAAPVLSHLSAADCVVHLVDGYCREKKSAIPTPLRITVMHFVMDMFPRFDTCPPRYQSDVLFHGTSIHRGKNSMIVRSDIGIRQDGRSKPTTTSGMRRSWRPGTMSYLRNDFVPVIFASSCGYSEGVHDWKLRVDSSSHDPVHDYIGIISSTRALRSTLNQCDSGTDANGYHVFPPSPQPPDNAYFCEALRGRNGDERRLLSGDVLTVHLNCAQWTCKFRLNGKLIVGSKLAIAPNRTYYLVVESMRHDMRFELIATKHKWK